MKQNWIIGISGSEMDNVITYRVCGTENQIKKHLLKLVKDDKEEYESEEYADWDYGTESKEEIQSRDNGKLYAYGCYESFHNDYTATPEMEVVNL